MLEKLTDRIYLKAFETERDRPVLGLICGDRLTLAVDAGHSAAHVDEFYREIRAEGLPLPDLTVLTHWHWDHTFGMHHVRGITIANRKTDEYLRTFEERVGVAHFRELHPSIRREYAEGTPVIVVPADLVFDGSMSIDLGGVTVALIRAESPHTDDSTLVAVREEGVVFLGDCTCGAFPTWKADPLKTQALIEVLERIDCGTCVHGHWEERSKEAVIERMRSEL